MTKENKIDYAGAGVDIDAADQAVNRIKKLAGATFNKSVLTGIGSFGGFFKPDMTGISEPVFISSTDSVGTKTKIAFLTGVHDTLGQCLVNHCVNDILVHGAKPLFFLDYIGIGKVTPDVIEKIVKGCAVGCKNSGMALIAGEIAEMPDIYSEGEYDLVGFIVGMVDKNKIINGSTIKDGDLIIGLGSTGLHTNGFTLARKIAFEKVGLKPDDKVDTLGTTIGQALLEVHKSYLMPINDLLVRYEIAGMAHITGGGIAGNLVRILPDNIQAVIQKGSWESLPIFDWLQKNGPVAEDEMYRAFNMGIGYILVVPADIADNVIEALKKSGESAYKIGKIQTGEKKVILKD
ncbi:MAG TPA: phosphoribosylformylglycinamidine cyclo-ligase [candidate division Zixibacteria bacterium]|nr:phosphoribosylformylglycinamidine cyclo-ligase [candidate division Zixibacteria bacterium]